MTDIIGFEQFADEVQIAMKSRYPDDRVEIKRVTKNNGVIYTGITVSSEDEKVYPTMYLEPFYEETVNGSLTDELIDRMCGIYESRRVGNTLSLDHLCEYMAVKDRLRCKLINYEANKAILEDIPYRRFLDLAIVPYCIVMGSDIGGVLPGEASFVITYRNLEMWDVKADEVMEESIRNTLCEENPCITEMYELLKRLNPSLTQVAGDEMKKCPMYVMTTEGSNGAVSMIYEDKIKEFCDRIDSDVYVIPSSINEIILVPSREDTSSEMLNDMVKEINATQLEPVEVLSDHVYYFEKDAGYKEAV
ncbi:MAG: hypothetical protein IKP31_04160 [Lachnospiraceae bacterium]|nr:hypothetical protein [Lachnospiraceae bacterium]